MSQQRFTTDEALRLVRKYGSAKSAADVLGVSRQSVCRRLNAKAPGWKTRRGIMVSHRFTDADKARAISLYLAGAELLDISAETGISLKWLNTLMRREGIQRRPGGGPRYSPSECLEMFAKFGTYAAAADVIGCSVSTVARAVQGAR